MKPPERFLYGIALTVVVVAVAAVVGGLISWHAETSMGWEAAKAGAAGWQGAFAILAVAFGVVAMTRK